MKCDDQQMSLHFGEEGKSKTELSKAPVIISASRAMDVPAFHSEWFMNQLRKGHVDWTNPFNGKTSRVSFEFYSKWPENKIDYWKITLKDRKGIC